MTPKSNPLRKPVEATAAAGHSHSPTSGRGERVLQVAACALLLLSTASFAADHANHAAHAGHDAKPATPTPAQKPASHAHGADRSPVAVAGQLLVVHKSPTCGCCAKWIDHLRAEGFTVEVRDTTALREVKERVGIPPAKISCHTAEVAGYFVEGHVPAEDIRRLLAEKPDARGITAPGMPMGSPGMEMPDGSVPKYAVELVRKDGSTEVFAEHGEGAAGADDHAHHDHAH